MKRNQSNLLVLGLAIGFCVGMGLAWILDGDVATVLANKPWEPLTLPVTLFVGILAYLGIQAQIKQQYQLAEEQRQNRLKAARAVLPQVLSNILALCAEGFRLQTQIADLRKNPSKARAAFEQLIITSDQLQTIKECIEFGDDTSTAWLSLILAHYQIEVARLKNQLFGELPPLNHKVESSQVDWEVIASMIGHLFDFARTGQSPKETLTLTADLASQMAGPQTREFTESFNFRRELFKNNGGLSYSAFQERLTKFF